MKRKIKIIHILPTLDAGGAEKQAVDIATSLDSDIFDVEIILTKRGGFWEKSLKSKKIPMHIIGNKFGFSPLLLLKLFVFLKKHKPDIVHTHLFGADVYGRLAAYLAKVGLIVSTEQNLNYSEGFFKKIAKKFTNRLAHFIVSASKSIKEYIIDKENVSPQKIKVIHNSVYPDKFKNIKHEKNKVFTIGIIGRLTKQKGQEVLIKALSFLNKDFKCLIAGEGEDKNKLQKQIDKLGLENKIKLVGLVDNVPMFLEKLDLFVLPSRWEGFGIVLLEAGSAGVPVLASNVDGPSEIIDNNKTGLLFKTGDAKDLFEKIEILMNDKKLRERLSSNFKKEVLEKYNIKKISKEYQKFYLDNLEKR